MPSKAFSEGFLPSIDRDDVEDELLARDDIDVYQRSLDEID